MNSQKDEHKIHKSACTPASTLGEVPMDTLIHIQSFMDPLDIIALRQSSKTLASATLHRIVWMDALRRVCAGHEVSVLTYPIEKMSLRDLEHAATSPARFIAQISKDWSSRADGGLVPAFSTRLLQPRLPKLTPGHLGELLLMRLVPGGRYPRYDQRHRPHEYLGPWIWPRSYSESLPFADGKGIRILVYFTVFIQTQITVFEVSPAATQPVFKVVAERRVPSLTINACALTPDRFTYHCDFLITTWNFVEDTSATVHVYQRMLNITVTPTTIIGQHAEGIVVVDIPPLHPTGTPAAEAIVEPITPLPMLSHIHAVLGDVSDLYTTQSDWHSAPDVPIVIDCFGILVDGTNAYARCLIKTVPGEDLDLPCALPVLMGVTRVPPETWEVDFYGRLHFAGTHLVRTWPTGSSVMINVAAVPARRQIVFESKTSLLWEMPPQGELWAYDLDPMSGRFVTLASPTEIRILDYILPNM
ncbi:hypothetical protein C8F04DRAFT_1262307 [Mycena alexandri]|uniref:F-box domain-containing protein n=1 Tax=Mycena alexandri TaxID=1745969 RepID=A0AAD6WYB6_9AGAR|nr:hypothetical protein C8F04DRAFT_1262307 [Mycena alexandri]